MIFTKCGAKRGKRLFKNVLKVPEISGDPMQVASKKPTEQKLSSTPNGSQVISQNVEYLITDLCLTYACGAPVCQA